METAHFSEKPNNSQYEKVESLTTDAGQNSLVLLRLCISPSGCNHNTFCKMRPDAKTMALVNQLMTEVKEDAKKAAYAFFNKCDYCDLVNSGACIVDMDRRDSFIEYAKSKGVTPNGGAFTENMKAQYFYIS